MTVGKHQGQALLTLGALGVVYGDIGTSPLYTMREVFQPSHGIPLDAQHITGAVSVIVWGLMFIVTLKYVILILRADNRGEGGILALAALAARAAGSTPKRRAALLLTGVLGASLFYGDSIITPAISVLGAVEGLEVATPAFKPFVIPIALGILIGLFAMQRFGTGVVGKLFGPVIALWFAVLAATGIAQIVQVPGILAALDPRSAIGFVQGRGWGFLVVLGSIVLAFTGAEALYADLGHFGRRPIRTAWGALVLPSLALNYMGQGALLMRDPAALDNPFFRLFPQDLLIPAVILSAAATVIASQAVITGAYSLTQQAVQLGLLPRLHKQHTSQDQAGQIYVPAVNWMLLVAVVMAVLGFGSSSGLASAYGIAVTVTMLVTTLLTFFIVRHAWRYPMPIALAATGVFALFDLALVAACSLKVADGGWFPLVLGTALFIVMASWRRGRELLMDSIEADGISLGDFVRELAGSSVPRARRTAVYAVASTNTVPQALLHNLKHNQVLHERNVILTVRFDDVPHVADDARLQAESLAPGFWTVRVHYGFMDTPDIPRALAQAARAGLPLDPFETTYFLSRETIVPSPKQGMAPWRERLFALMSRNAANIADFLRLPDNCVIELGTRVQI